MELLVADVAEKIEEQVTQRENIIQKYTSIFAHAEQKIKQMESEKNTALSETHKIIKN